MADPERLNMDREPLTADPATNGASDSWMSPDGIPRGRASPPHTMRVAVVRHRITFSKSGVMRFTGHLDLARVWERTLRRARLPVAFSQGFTPRVRMTFAAPLGLGATGDAELVDIWFVEPIEISEVAVRLSAELPRGCAIVAVKTVNLDEPALTTLVRWATYTVRVGSPHGNTMAVAVEGGSRWARRVPDEAVVEAQPTIAIDSETARETPPRRPTVPEQLIPNPNGNPDDPWRPASEWLYPVTPPSTLPSAIKLQAMVTQLMAGDSVIVDRVRDGRTVTIDVRAYFFDASWLAFAPDQTHATIWLAVRHDVTGTGRPEDFVRALGLEIRDVIRLAIGLDGEPVPKPPLSEGGG